MGTTDRELKQIAANIERMAAADPPTGWQIRPGHAEATWIVASPHTTDVLTFGARVGAGQGKQKAIAELRRIGYFDDWTRYRVEVAAKRQANDIPDPFVVPAQPTTTPGETVSDAPTPAQMPTKKRPAEVFDGPSRDLIDGQAVASRAPAMAPPMHGGDPVAVKGVEEILLGDGRVLYQCVRSVRCFKAFPVLHSATSHLKMHGRATQAAKDDAEYARRSAGTKAGWVARKARQAALGDDDTRRMWLETFVGVLKDAVPMLTELQALQVGPSAAEQELAERLERAVAQNDEWRPLVLLYREIEAKFGEGFSVADLEALLVKAKKWDAFVAARDAV